MINRHNAIKKLYPNVQTSVGTKSFDKNGNEVAVDEKAVSAEVAKIEEDLAKVQYKEDRKFAYPDLEECIHALLDEGDTLTKLQEKRTAVKNKYPKPG